ncbi:MAG: TPM domain-containing protein [Cyclobacteriaceae bacterium]|nr:TPM domain-containing protein [Cyclobacteriaceae bacterium]
MDLRNTFSEADMQQIKAAVHEAESKISGEIVPVIVPRSGYYNIANYKAGIMASSLVFLLVVISDKFIPAYAVYDPLLIFLIVITGGLLGAVLPNFSDTIRRMLVSQVHMEHAARQRAENAFLKEEVFNTRHRTGIMIFVSFFEHEVIVMADRGISKVVEQKVWDKIVRDLTESIRKRKITEGIVAAIKQCGDVLLEKGFKKTSDDVNELRDDLRIN